MKQFMRFIKKLFQFKKKSNLAVSNVSLPQNGLSIPALSSASANLGSELEIKDLEQKTLEEELHQEIMTSRRSILSDADYDNALENYISLTGGDHSSLVGVPKLEQDKLKSQFITFLQDANKKTFLILGEAGSGKTTFALHLERKLWAGYVPGNAIPVFIDLVHVGGRIDEEKGENSDKPQRFFEHMKNHFKIYTHSSQKMEILKKKYHFVFFLDAFDETKSVSNIYEDYGLESWQAKVVVLCRRDYYLNVLCNKISSDARSNIFVPVSFQGPRAFQALAVSYILPLSKAKIAHYMNKYKSNEDSKFELYQEYMNKLSKFNELLGNPFFLKVAMKAMPELVKNYSDRETKQLLDGFTEKLMDIFIDRLFEFQECKLVAAGELPEDGSDIKDLYWNFALDLAKRMSKKGLYQVVEAAESPANSEWKEFFGTPKDKEKEKVLSKVRAGCSGILNYLGKGHVAFIDPIIQLHLNGKLQSELRWTMSLHVDWLSKKRRNEVMNYIHLNCYQETTPLGVSNDLLHEIKLFLKDPNKKTFLLIGESGSGKTIFGHFLEKVMLENYGYKSNDTIPLYMDLTKLGSAYREPQPFSNLVKNYINNHYSYFSRKELAELKQQCQFVFIIDGYDKIPYAGNLYEGSDLGSWSAKIVVLCSPKQYENTDYNCFTPPSLQGTDALKNRTKCFISPFSDAQISHSVSAYTQNAQDRKTKIGWTDPQEYQKYISALPRLKELLRNPFILKLALEVMPKLVAEYNSVSNKESYEFNRRQVLDAYIMHSLELKINELASAGALSKEGNTLKEQGWTFIMNLALKMRQKGIFQVTYTPRDFCVWPKIKKSHDEWTEWDPFFDIPDDKSEARDLAQIRTVCADLLKSQEQGGSNNLIYEFISPLLQDALYSKACELKLGDDLRGKEEKRLHPTSTRYDCSTTSAACATSFVSTRGMFGDTQLSASSTAASSSSSSLGNILKINGIN